MASCDDVHIFFASYTSKYQNSSLALSSVGSQVFSDLLGSTAAVPGWSAPRQPLPTHLFSPEAKSECEVLGHPHVGTPLRVIGSKESHLFSKCPKMDRRSFQNQHYYVAEYLLSLHV